MRQAVTTAQMLRREFIVANWRAMSDSDLAENLNTTRNNVRHIRIRLGCRRDSGMIAALHARGKNKSGYKRHRRDHFY